MKQASTCFGGPVKNVGQDPKWLLPLYIRMNGNIRVRPWEQYRRV